MSDLYPKGISDTLKGLGFYQIAGGIIGIALVFWRIATMPGLPIYLWIIFLGGLVPFSYSIYCGVLLLKNKENGLYHSQINQYLQLINFSILGYGLLYVSGVYVAAGIDLTKSIDFEFNVGISMWRININSYKDAILINFNFVALFLIVWIDKLKHKWIEEKFKEEFSVK